ncbi:radical SAM protein, partial [Candidatus Bathyarchaeota archaeon]|nr:radical SAM protein [Candidatus Bathyarchaeota archaeon]
SGICDPYQPLEMKYEVTRSCLEILLKRNWPVCIQTKSPLVLRDMALLQKSRNVEVTMTITTGNESIRRIFEPKAPPIKNRIDALRKLHSAGIKTCVMIAPILPGAELLIDQISGIADSVLIDRMNYHYADWVYRKHGLEYALKDEFFTQKKRELTKALEKAGIPCEAVF